MFLDDEGQLGDEVYVCYIDKNNNVHERKDKFKRYLKYSLRVKKYADKLNNGKKETRRIYVHDEMIDIIATIKGTEEGDLMLHVNELENMRTLCDVKIQSNWKSGLELTALV